MYECSSDGRIRNAITGRILIPRLSRGYLVINLHAGARYGLRKKPKQVTKPVHVLVCRAFHGVRPRGKWAAHNNGIKTDCSANNLRWDTPASNQRDKMAHGTANRGAAHGMSKLSDSDVQKIIESTDPQKVIASQYGITQQHVSYLKRRKGWKHLEIR
jgi:hypothetical protein